MDSKTDVQSVDWMVKMQVVAMAELKVGWTVRVLVG